MQDGQNGVFVTVIAISKIIYQSVFSSCPVSLSAILQCKFEIYFRDILCNVSFKMHLVVNYMDSTYEQ